MVSWLAIGKDVRNSRQVSLLAYRVCRCYKHYVLMTHVKQQYLLGTGYLVEADQS